MRAFVSVSYQHRPALTPVIETIQATLQERGIEAFVFVDAYHFPPYQAHEMMQRAFTEIERCDLLIAEVSHKAIGVGIEIGYAIGLGKPVIYLRHAEAEHSTTASGTATHSLIYDDTNDLQEKFSRILLGNFLTDDDTSS